MLRAELDRAGRAGGRELDDAEPVVEREVGVEPPPHPRVEVLGPVDVRDRDHDHLELHVHQHVRCSPLMPGHCRERPRPGRSAGGWTSS